MIHAHQTSLPLNFLPLQVSRSVPKLAIILAGTVLLSACASSPEAPTQSLHAAQQAITTAEQAGVADYSSIELSTARAKLAAAHTAVKHEEMVRAKRMAEEAFVSAKLATARAEELKAEEVNAQMKASTETLKVEMRRNTGQQQ
ncbi:DUF4398 domain-containing protein [Nitrincola alkalilacustris]|uniref:DUF4398 domain-containing protein n=1 Tax=Nitrincola alkalilacustris TaxID=1571224 RepID=UPI00124F44D9|nr:DUF4398 domain-containing protein [Nitrincola alkalilacustris]